MRHVWQEFKQFAFKGNMIDLAVGVIIGAAFGKIVTTLVEGVLMPPIGLALGRIDFSSLFYVLDSSRGVPASLADAKTKGIPVLAYGQLMSVFREEGSKLNYNPAGNSEQINQGYEEWKKLVAKQLTAPKKPGG